MPESSNTGRKGATGLLVGDRSGDCLTAACLGAARPEEFLAGALLGNSDPAVTLGSVGVLLEPVGPVTLLDSHQNDNPALTTSKGVAHPLLLDAGALSCSAQCGQAVSCASIVDQHAGHCLVVAKV